jgi:hypothetical protein
MNIAFAKRPERTAANALPKGVTTRRPISPFKAANRKFEKQQKVKP